MSTAPPEPQFWSEEPSKRPGRRRVRARVGGLHCSLCTGTIEKALGRRPGVDKVAVSLTHEQALIEYDPEVTRAEDLLGTLKDIGYTVSDPRKLRPFDEEERALVRERGRFLTGLAMSIAAMGVAGYPVQSAWFWLCVFSIASLVVFPSRSCARMACGMPSVPSFSRQLGAESTLCNCWACSEDSPRGLPGAGHSDHLRRGVDTSYGWPGWPCGAGSSTSTCWWNSVPSRAWPGEPLA